MRTLVFTATYNEADNIASLVRECLAALPDADMLVVDDNSPDGTSDILTSLAVEMSGRLKVITRPRKLGLGSAHKLAMKFALRESYDVLVTMDADYSHHPSHLPALISKLDQHDFVIGSRYTNGGSFEYSFVRRLISRTANLLVRVLLGVRLRETTTSYRGFKSRLLAELPIDEVQAEGYAFFFESIFYVGRLSDRVCEVPIQFADRRAGASKISRLEIVRAVQRLAMLFAQRMTGRVPRSSRGLTSENAQTCRECGDNLFSSNWQRHKANRSNSSEYGSVNYSAKCLVCGAVNPQ